MSKIKIINSYCIIPSFVKESRINWFEAKVHCKEEGGELVEFDSIVKRRRARRREVTVIHDDVNTVYGNYVDPHQTTEVEDS